MTITSTVGITREASTILDGVSKTTGMSKLYLTSTLIKLFFDPNVNPSLSQALSAFEVDKKAAEHDFVDRVIASIRSENKE